MKLHNPVLYLRPSIWRRLIENQFSHVRQRTADPGFQSRPPCASLCQLQRVPAQGLPRRCSALRLLRRLSQCQFQGDLGAGRDRRHLRFAVRGPNIQRSQCLELPVWSFQIRVNQGHSKTAFNRNPELATATAISFFDPRPRPTLPGGEKDQTAARHGKPLERQGDNPSVCVTDGADFRCGHRRAGLLRGRRARD